MKTLVALVLAITATAACQSAADRQSALSNAKTWMYQIQNVDWDGRVDTLAASDYDVLVIEPTYTYEQGFPVGNVVERLSRKPDGSDRLVIAYIDIGQAEDWRYYWGDNWRAPTRSRRGFPDFLVTVDPDGWEGNYPVAYWYQGWKDIWVGPDGLIAELADFGFDGVYLDWIEAYDDEDVMAVAAAEGVDPAVEMVQFIDEIRASGSAGFLVIAQNAPFLVDDVRGEDASVNYFDHIDAIAQEGVWYTGNADVPWNSPAGGDIPNPWDGRWTTEGLLRVLRRYKAAGLPVFTVDYSLRQSTASQVYEDSCTEGFVPLVTRVSLAEMTQTPPAADGCGSVDDGEQEDEDDPDSPAPECPRCPDPEPCPEPEPECPEPRPCDPCSDCPGCPACPEPSVALVPCGSAMCLAIV